MYISPRWCARTSFLEFVSVDSKFCLRILYSFRLQFSLFLKVILSIGRLKKCLRMQVIGVSNEKVALFFFGRSNNVYVSVFIKIPNI